MKKVSVYVREHSTRKLRKATDKDFKIADTIYVLRFGSAWETLPEGTDLQQARVAAIHKETQILLGKVVAAVPKPRTEKPGALDVLIDTYLASIAELKSHKTLLAYSVTLKGFYASCKCATIAEVNNDTLENFVMAMKAGKLGDRTIANRLVNVITFLGKNGIKDVTLRHKYTEKTVKAYREDELKAFFKACDPEEWLLFQFFLCTGAREQEVMHAAYSDIDFRDGIYTVTAKANWNPKDSEEREIPIPNISWRR